MKPTLEGLKIWNFQVFDDLMTSTRCMQNLVSITLSRFSFLVVSSAKSSLVVELLRLEENKSNANAMSTSVFCGLQRGLKICTLIVFTDLHESTVLSISFEIEIQFILEQGSQQIRLKFMYFTMQYGFLFLLEQKHL